MNQVQSSFEWISEMEMLADAGRNYSMLDYKISPWKGLMCANATYDN